MSEYFNISYDKADEAFASTIAAKADAVWRSIITRSGADVSQIGTIALIICPDAAHYIAATDKSVDEYEDWMVGNSNFEKKRICILSPRAAKMHTAAELEKVFVHESVHMFFDSLMPNNTAPLWCAEGIALYYADQIESDYMAVDDAPLISELSDEDSFADNGGYSYAGAYAKHYVDRFGLTMFMELYSGFEEAAALIYQGFEREAVLSFLNPIAK